MRTGCEWSRTRARKASGLGFRNPYRLEVRRVLIAPPSVANILHRGLGHFHFPRYLAVTVALVAQLLHQFDFVVRVSGFGVIFAYP